MAFINVFLKTLGFLIGSLTFVIILSLLISITSNEDNKFKVIEGEPDSKNIIAEISLNGPIFNNYNQFLTSDFISYIDPNKIKEQLKLLEKHNPKIVIFKINSPGGTVTATHNLDNIIKKFKIKNKSEIYFYSDEILTSGAYWVATSGDKIFANYGAIIGSIGANGPSWYYYKTPRSISKGIFGQKIETIEEIEIYNQSAGSSKDLYNPFRKPTVKELNHLQSMVQEIYMNFVNKVSSSRKIEKNLLINEIGALIYTSNQAKDNFLIDNIVEYEELVKLILKENNFKDYKILKIEAQSNFISKYMSMYFSTNLNNFCEKINISFTTISPTFVEKC